MPIQAIPLDAVLGGAMLTVSILFAVLVAAGLLFVGAAIGMVLMALCAAAARGEPEKERRDGGRPL